MKILLLGKNGQVGWELQRTLAPLGSVIALGRQELDLLDLNAMRDTVRAVKPDLIVNAAAYTAVDKAEEEPDLAMAINGTAPGILAEEALRCKAALIHFSTDYVFDGAKKTPYSEKDTPNPLNSYGKTKLAGEIAIRATAVPHLIFRTSWVYGLRGSNFLLTILRLARERDELNLVSDQHGAPTWSRMLAEITAQAVARGAAQHYKQGIFHLSAAGQTTWYQFAETILEQTEQKLGRRPALKAIRTEDYPAKAKRPACCLLDNALMNKHFGLLLPDWRHSLQLALADLII